MDSLEALSIRSHLCRIHAHAHGEVHFQFASFISPFKRNSLTPLRAADSIILTTVTMIVTGAYIYLPNHIRTVYAHMYYYWVGDRSLLSSSFPSITSVFGETATQKLEVMYETAKNTTTTTTESIAEL